MTADWPLHYAALLHYYKKHHTCNIPVSEFYECDLPNMGKGGNTYHYSDNLGNWLKQQRWHKSVLSPDQRSKLQSLVNQGKFLFFNLFLFTVLEYCVEWKYSTYLCVMCCVLSYL